MANDNLITESVDANTIHVFIPDYLKKEKAENHEIIYLSDFMEKLPEDCFFVKGVTGNGATTLAIEDDDNFVLAMPTRNTVMSKWVMRDPETHEIIGDRKDVFCIFGGFHDTFEELRQYMANRSRSNRVKIVCTYDQVGKVVNSLVAMGVNPARYRLYIDEIHEVLKDATNKNRRDSIMSMMKSIPMFRSVTCITATPLDSRYNDFFEETKHLKTYKVVYEEVEWNPKGVETDDIITTTRKYVLEHLKDERFGNAHIFLNSVRSISRILSRVDMEKYGGQIRIVCGDYQRNTDKIRREILKGMKRLMEYDDYVSFSQRVDDIVLDVLGKRMVEYKGLKVSSINSEVKKINFYTRTAWQGADVFDKDGQVYIVSDGNSQYTMVDPSTDLKQILGRIRDSQNLNYIRIFKPENDRYAEYKNNEYEANKALRTPEAVQEQIAMFQKIGIDLSDNEEALERYEAQWYLRYDPEKKSLVEDKCLKYLDEINYIVRNSKIVPSASMVAHLDSVDTTVSDKIKKSKRNARKGISFKAMCEEWFVLKGHGNRQLNLIVGSEDERRQTLEEHDQIMYDGLMVEAYNTIGKDAMIQAEFNRVKIKNLIAVYRAERKREDIYMHLKARGVIKGARFFGTELTDKLKEVQLRLNLDKPLKYSALFDVKTTTRRIDGKIQRGVVIMGRKTIADVIEGH